MKEILVTKEYAGGRMDKLVLKYLDKAPTGFVYKVLRKKNIVLNGKKAKGSEILKKNDRIRLYLAEETIAKFRSAASREDAGEEVPVSKEAMEAFRQRIVFEDENLLAVHKPADLLSQKASASDLSLNELVIAYLETEGLAEANPAALFSPGISNRLDRNTTGLVLAGKNPAASRELNRGIRERNLDKYYLCLVKGRLEETATLDGWLIKNEKANRVRVIRKEEEPENGARIQTAYQPVAQGADLTLLPVKLITGKSHQIRAHLASIGHPVIGDGKYGSKICNTCYQDRYGLSRQLLHAHRIVFREMKEPLSYLNGREITAPLPEDFARILKAELPEGYERIRGNEPDPSDKVQ